MRLKSEQYFDAIQGMIDRFAMKKDLEVVYVTSTIPSQSIINALEVLEIPMDHIWFVDCISQIMMSQEKRHPHAIDRKSTRLNSSHITISYAVFCLKKKKKTKTK